MWNRHKKQIILTTLLAFVPLIAGLLLWKRLPEQIPVHFNINGEADRYSSRLEAVLLIGLIFPGVHILCTAGTLADPKRNNISTKMFNFVLWITPIIAALTSFICYGSAIGMKMDVTVLTGLLIGATFIIIGNYMPKCRQNYTVGIKLPWTLNDKDNWDRTHRFAGYVYVVAGILMIFSLLFTGDSFIVPCVMIFAIACGFLPVIYSYMLYRKNGSS